MIDLIRCLDLLWAHVAVRTHGLTSSCLPVAFRLRDTEVANLGNGSKWALCDEDVRRLDVAVDDLLPMGMMYRGHDGDKQIQYVLYGRCSVKTLDVLLEVRTIHELHHDPSHVRVRDGAEHTDDVGMSSLGLNVSLKPKALSYLGDGLVLRIKNLDHTVTLQNGVAHQIHLTHAALTEQLDHLIALYEISGSQHRRQHQK